jgi:hypothetical protein
MRPNRAAVTPFGLQNPPGPLKLLGLRKKKQAKIPIFDFAKRTDFVDAHFVTSCGYPADPPSCPFLGFSHHNIAENDPPEPKNGTKRRV